MARGWESKGVEESQAEHGRKEAPPPRLSPEERARQQRRAGLELSRARAAEQLAVVTSPARRAALESALAQLDGEIATLAGPAGAAGGDRSD